MKKLSKRGYFGIGVYHPKTEENIGTLWRTAFLYGADFIFTIGARYRKQPSDTPDVSKHVPLYNYTSIEDFKEHMPHNASLVCVELSDKSQSLTTTHHPERAIYLLGAEDYGIPEDILFGNQTIQIPTVVELSMNVAVAGSIILYDRFAKVNL